MKEKRIALTCKDPETFFHDCKGCKYYNNCNYFQKVERRKKKKAIFEIQENSTFLDTDTGKMYKWNRKERVQIFPEKEAL